MRAGAPGVVPDVAAGQAGGAGGAGGGAGGAGGGAGGAGAGADGAGGVLGAGALGPLPPDLPVAEPPEGLSPDDRGPPTTPPCVRTGAEVEPADMELAAASGACAVCSPSLSTSAAARRSMYSMSDAVKSLSPRFAAGAMTGALLLELVGSKFVRVELLLAKKGIATSISAVSAEPA